MARDIGAGADGTLKIIDLSGHVFTWGDGWQENHNVGSVSRIAVAPDGRAWIVTTDGTIYQQTGPSSWKQVHNALAMDISVAADGTVWIATKGGGTRKLTDTSSSMWTEMGVLGSQAYNIAAHNYAYATRTDGAIFKEETYAAPLPAPPPAPLLPLPNPVTDPIVFDGNTSATVALGTLPASFTVSAEVRIDASSQWQHVIELGGLEHGMTGAPFRLEVGNEGQWYVAIGDGTSYAEATIPGAWTYGSWTPITVTYNQGVCKLYENGQLLHTFTADKDVTLAEGSLILGSYQGNQRYFQGGLRNVSITAGETPPVQ